MTGQSALLELLAVAMGAGGLVFAGLTYLLVRSTKHALEEAAHALAERLTVAERWHEDDKAVSITARLTSLETSRDLTDVKMVGLPTAADIVGLKGAVELVQQAVEHQEELAKRREASMSKVESAVDRIEQHLMERSR